MPMKAEYINPFVTSAVSVIGSVLGGKPSKGSLAMRPASFTTQQCNIITEVTGQIEGQVLYGMSLTTADKICSRMIGAPVRTFDQMAASAVAELANIITGNAMAQLSQLGYLCHITPPTIVRGTNKPLSNSGRQSLVIPLQMEHGEIELTVCLRERS